MAVISNEQASSKFSLHAISIEEACRHKWIESEKQGRDLGHEAIRQWYCEHWLKYCRSKRIEHVIGCQAWQEFEDGPSSLILALLQSNDLLVQLIVDRLSQGWENLDVIVWGITWGLPMERIQEILLELNINCARFDPAISLETRGD
ncbi:MAG: hypothetical protein JKY95_13605 [Planctomycetaceae bacterium]|nr:hypothetical protein [Planctomycetaceae bacterium]